MKPQCPNLWFPKFEVCRVGKKSDKSPLDSYTMDGKINGFSISMLRNIGTTVVVVGQKHVSKDRLSREHMWVQNIFDEHMTCLSFAESDVECNLGMVATKAVIIENNNLDQERYLLWNQTGSLVKQVDENYSFEYWKYKCSPHSIHAATAER